jgi:hypothetical protein
MDRIWLNQLKESTIVFWRWHDNILKSGFDWGNITGNLVIVRISVDVVLTSMMATLRNGIAVCTSGYVSELWSMRPCRQVLCLSAIMSRTDVLQLEDFQDSPAEKRKSRARRWFPNWCPIHSLHQPISMSDSFTHLRGRSFFASCRRRRSFSRGTSWAVSPCGVEQTPFERISCVVVTQILFDTTYRRSFEHDDDWTIVVHAQKDWATGKLLK